MRRLFGCLAGLLCVVSVALAARYGYKGADTEIDGAISGVVFGLIALCACLFDAAAVRLWFMKHHIGAVVIGLIAAAALVVTFTNSLGAIASRSDITQAERSSAKADEATDRAELRRVMRERAALIFTPATDDTVKVAREAATAAERIRLAECGSGDPKQRGPKCRDRETDEQGKRDALAKAFTNKALTDKATKLDADAGAVQGRLAKAPSVQNANPLGATLEQMIGATAAALTAWQQAIVAAVFELCLVGVMVIFELLGHPIQPTQKRPSESAGQGGLDVSVGAKKPRAYVIGVASPASRPKAVSVAAQATGTVKRFAAAQIFPAEGERVEIKAVIRDYRSWCVDENLSPLSVDAFLDEFEKLCRKLGIETTVGDDQRVYCLDVKLQVMQPAARV